MYISHIPHVYICMFVYIYKGFKDYLHLKGKVMS